jgi:hypothetical protein
VPPGKSRRFHFEFGQRLRARHFGAHEQGHEFPQLGVERCLSEEKKRYRKEESRMDRDGGDCEEIAGAPFGEGEKDEDEPG